MKLSVLCVFFSFSTGLDEYCLTDHLILYCLMEYEPIRFNEMQRYINNVADKTLSQNLKELERDGLIHRKMYPQVPLKVEYTLTERGLSLAKVLDQLCDWGNQNRPESYPDLDTESL